MPEICHYVVERTQRVEVWANRADEAVQVANAAFDHGQDSAGRVALGKLPEGVWGNTRGRIRTVSMAVREDR